MIHWEEMPLNFGEMNFNLIHAESLDQFCTFWIWRKAYLIFSQTFFVILLLVNTQIVCDDEGTITL